jgi:hypothetical protein
MEWREWIFGLLLALLPEPDYETTCRASVFGYPGDKYGSGSTLLYGRPVEKSDFGIAHRRLRLGTPVVIFHPKTCRFAVGVVLDRGPYGAMHEGKWRIKRRRSEPGIWRGCADLTYSLARSIGHNGFERVKIYAWKRKEPQT